MYELIQINQHDYYIDCPAKIGVVLTEENEAVIINESARERTARDSKETVQQSTKIPRGNALRAIPRKRNRPETRFPRLQENEGASDDESVRGDRVGAREPRRTGSVFLRFRADAERKCVKYDLSVKQNRRRTVGV